MKLGGAIFFLVFVALSAPREGAAQSSEAPITIFVGGGETDEVIAKTAESVLIKDGWQASRAVGDVPPENRSHILLKVTADGKALLGTLVVGDVEVSSRRYIEDGSSAILLKSLTESLMRELLDKRKSRLSPSTLTVQCEPQGLTLRLDGMGHLSCDAANSISVGRHTVVAQKAGYRPGTYSVLVEAAENETLHILLTKDTKSRMLWYAASGAVLIGVAGVAVGVTDWVTHSDAVESDERQSETRNRRGLGIALTATGGAFLVGGGVLAYLAYQRDRELAVAPTVVDGGSGLVFVGSF